MAFRIPVIADSDEEVIKACIASALEIDYENPKIIIIKNSLEIEEIFISEAMLKEAEANEHIAIKGSPFTLDFDQTGNLKPLF